MKRSRLLPRHPERLLFLAAAVFLSMVSLPFDHAPGWFPQLSPLLSWGGALAARTVGWLAVLGLPVVLFAFWRGRWFCRHVCPTGLLAEWAGLLRPGRPRLPARFPHLGRPFALMALGGACAGYVWFLWMDPLALFQGFLSAWRAPFAWAHTVPAVGFLLVLALSVMRPHLWCHRLCPLGGLQDILAFVRHGTGAARRSPEPSAYAYGRMGRRAFMALAAGGVAAAAARSVTKRAVPGVVRPPGAVPEDCFTALCARCGNCMSACPYDILQPDVGGSGVLGFLTPVADFTERYCSEWCRDCTAVCPTGALQPLSLEVKQERPMGRAVIDHEHCIAWTDGEHCMVCQEFCPYLAVESVESNGVPCPVVDEDACRGCGACESQCPARPVRAIIVHGIER